MLEGLTEVKRYGELLSVSDNDVTDREEGPELPAPLGAPPSGTQPSSEFKGEKTGRGNCFMALRVLFG